MLTSIFTSRIRYLKHLAIGFYFLFIPQLHAQLSSQWSLTVSGSDNNSNSSLIDLKISKFADEFSQVSNIKNTTTREDIFWSRINALGVQIASHTFTGPGNRKVFARDMATNGSRYYITGFSEIDDDEDHWLTYSLDSTGSLLWVDSFDWGAEEADFAQKIVLSNFGVIVAGRVTNANEKRSVHVRALDSLGAFQWSFTIPGNFAENSSLIDLQITDDGITHLYTAQSHQPQNNNRCIIYRLSPTGTLLDSIVVSTNNTQLQPKAIKLSLSGKVYVLNQKEVSGQDINTELIAYESNGIVLWTQLYNSTGSNKDEAIGLDLDSLNQIWVAVESKFSVNDCRGRILRYDSLGNLLGQQNLQIINGSKNKPSFIRYQSQNKWLVGGSEERTGNTFGFVTLLDDSASILSIQESALVNSNCPTSGITASEKLIFPEGYLQSGIQRLKLNSFCQAPTSNITTTDTTSPCAGDSIFLSTQLPIGGTNKWFRNDTLLAQNLSDILISLPGNYVVRNSNGLGCTSTSSPIVITNRVRPIPAFNAPTALCQNAPLTPFTGINPAGGVFSGSGVSASNFSASAAGVGTHIISYMVLGSNGCTGSTQRTVVVNPVPSAFFAIDSTSLCIGSGPQVLTPVVFGGVFLGTGISGNIFNPQSLPAGLYNITYLISNAFGCSAQLTRQVNVLNPPTLSLGNVPTLCSNGTQQLLTIGSPSGGIYSGTGIVSGGFFNPAISGPGNFAIVYTIANAGCTARDTFNITVNQAPIATVSIRTDSLVAPVFGGSYQWFIANDSIIGATDSIFIPILDGLYSVRLQDTTSCTTFSPQVNYIVGGSPLFSDLESHIKIYPNPTSGQVSIEAIQEGILEIYTAEGRSAGIYRLLPGLNTILLSKVSAGFYTLIIREDRNNSIKRGRLVVISALD